MMAESLALLASLFLLSLGSGAWLVKQPRLLPLPTAARFVLGAALAPHLIGFLLLAWLAFLPGASLSAAAGLPATLGLLLLWRSRSVAEHFQHWLRRWHHRPWPRMTAWASGATLAVAIGLLAWTNAQAPILAFDALQYAREALALGEAGSLSGWVGHTGSADGSLRGDIHHPVFPAYLLWALQFCDWPGALLPADFPMRLAFQATLMAMLAALLLPGLAVGQRWFAVLVPALVLAVPGFDYISNSFSRDAFRIVPLAAWLAVMIRWGSMPSRHRRCPALAAWACLLTALTCASHTLNLVALASAAIGWGLWVVTLGRWKRAVRAALAVTIGAILGSHTMVHAWLDSGSIQGTGVLMYDAIRGGPLEGPVRQMELQTLGDSTTVTDRARDVLLRDGLGIGVVGTLAAGGMVLMAAFRRRLPPSTAAAWMSLALAAPALGALDWLGYPVSEWFAVNKRYLLHWYPFLAVTLMTVTAALLGWHAFGWRKAIVVVVAAAAAWAFTVRHWPTNHWGPSLVLDYVEPLREVAADLAPRRLLLEDARWNYYLGNRHVLMFAAPTSTLLIPEDRQTLRAGMEALGIGGVVLISSSIPPLWETSPLYHLLRDEGDVRTTPSGFTIFVGQADRNEANLRREE